MPRPTRHPLRTTSLIGSAALLVAAPLGVARSAGAVPDDARPGVQTISYDYVQQPPVIGPPICGPEGCIGSFSIRGTSTGALAGSFTQSGTAVRFPDGVIFANSLVVFSGTVEPCGAGTVVMRSTGYNRAGATSGDIVIVDGSGTGDLAGLTGEGMVVAGQADPGGGGTASGTIVLRVRCRDHS